MRARRCAGDGATKRSRLAETAVDAFRTAGWRVEEAFALELAGRTADAVALFRAVGAWARCGGSRKRGPRRRAAAASPRSPRASARSPTLVVAGHATRAIADSLVISERTVETHIAAVYRKLGVTNRTALARLLGDAGAAAP